MGIPKRKSAAKGRFGIENNYYIYLINPFIMKIYKICLLILFILITQNTFSQTNYVLSFPKNEKGLTEDIKIKLQADFQKTEFRSNPNLTFPDYARKNYLPKQGQHYSFYIVKLNDNITKHTISSQSFEKKEQLVSLVSRSSGLEFYNLSDFEEYYKDTIVIFDTLCLDFSKLYELSNECIHMVGNGQAFDHPNENAPVFLTASAFKVIPGTYFTAELSCKTYPKKTYSSTLLFLGNEEKEELREFVKAITLPGNTIDPHDMVQQIQAYIYLRWGKCQAGEVLQWFRHI